MNNDFYYSDNQNNEVKYSSSQKNLLLVFTAIVLIAVGYISMTSGIFDKVNGIETTTERKIVYVGEEETIKVKSKTNGNFNPAVKFKSKKNNFTLSEDIQYGEEVETKIIGSKVGSDTLVIYAGKDASKKEKSKEVEVIVCDKPEITNTGDETLNIKENTSVQLSFNVADECLKGYEIEIENDSVASIDSNYNLSAKKVGTTSLVLKRNDDRIKYKINVNSTTVAVKSVKVNTKSFNLAIGKTEKLSISVLPSDATNRKVTYKSSDENIATVSSDGTVKGISVGTATITVTSASDSSKSGSVKVKVYKQELVVTSNASTVSVASVAFKSSSYTIEKGSTQNLEVVVSPSNATNKTITCKSSNTSVATATAKNNTCVVKGVKKGTVTITVTSKDGSKKGTTTVTINEKTSTTVNVTGVSFESNSYKVYVGSTTNLVATVSPSNATTKTITCKSSNTSVATVTVSNNTCVAKGVKAGTATITVTTKDGSKTATASLTVENKPVVTVSVTSIKFDSSSYKIAYNETKKLVLGVTPTNASNKAITCKSLNTTIVTASSSGNICTIKGIKPGTTTIEAYSVDGNKTATVSITVSPIAVTSIAFEHASYDVNVGASATAVVKFTPSNASNQILTCSTSDSSIATVSAKGASCVVSGVKAGSVTITATSQDGNKTAKTTVKVNTVLVTGVSFATSSYSIDEGNTVTLTPTISPSTATNKGYTCSSNNTGVATITSGCTVKGVSAGTATITVTTSDGGKTSTATVTVKKAVNKVTVTFATFNVGYFNCGSYKGASCRPKPTDMVNLIKKYGIDVVGMQEAHDSSATINKGSGGCDRYGISKVKSIRSGLGYNLERWCHGGGVYATLSKYKIESSKEYSLGSGRYLSKVVVKINGVDISFYNSHLGLSDDDNETHFKKIADIVKSDPNPIIITADWNYIALARFKTYFLDPVDMKFTMAGYDTTSHNMWGKASYCDAILVKSKGHIDIVSSQTVDTYNSYSDHNMVIAKLAIY